MINIVDSFSLAGSTKPLDARDEFATVAEMKACTICNEKHICYVRENQRQYQYSSANTLDNVYGKWRPYTAGSGNGDVTGATIGGDSVEKIGGVLQFPAYPTVPEVPIKGIKANGASEVIAPDPDGVVELPAPPTIPITKIKLNGASSDLPINNGRVTIPDYANDIKEINNKFQQIGNPEPIVIPSSNTEVLVSGSNFTYDSDTTYIMSLTSGSSTTQVATVHYPYVHDNINYVAFKAIDRDLIYLYSVDGLSYIWVGEKTISQLPIEGKAAFESGKTATKHVINNDGTPEEGSFVHGTVNVFVSRHGYPLQYNQINESGTYYILIKNAELNKIYKYSAANNKWSLVSGGCYTKGNITTGANYTKYDKYFNGGEAVNTEYDDTVTQFGTQEHPVNNVQLAIQKIAVNIAAMACTVNVNVLKEGSPYIGKSVNVVVKYQGETITSWGTYNYTNLSTNSNGILQIVLPLAAEFIISFTPTTNFIEPETINGIADTVTKSYTVLYTPIAEQELLKPVCKIVGASTGTTPSGKRLFIDYWITNNSTWEEAVYIVNSGEDGLSSTVYKKGNNDNYTNVGVNNLLVDRGQKYKARLELWNTELTEEEQSYYRSEDQEFTANQEKRTIMNSYSYKEAGVFLVIKDTNNAIFGYKAYKVDGVRTESDGNNSYTVTTIIMENQRYDIKFVSGVGVQIKGVNEDTYTTWITTTEIINGKIVGIGVRTQALIDSSLLSQYYENTPLEDYYNNCCVLLYYGNGMSQQNKKWYISSTTLGLVTSSYYDGRYCTELFDGLEATNTTTSEILNYLQSYTVQTGNHTQTPFIASFPQMQALSFNNDFIKGLGQSINFDINFMNSKALATSTFKTNSHKGIVNGVNTGGYYGDYTFDTRVYVIPVYNFY